jgi:itaconate CoA-transferase
VATRDALDAEIEPIFAALDRGEAIRRLTASQIAWGKLTEVRELGAHAALRRMPVRLPNGSEILVPRPAGRSSLSGEPPSVPAMGAHTSRIRTEFTS